MSKQTRNKILNGIIVVTYITLMGLLVLSLLELNDKYNNEEVKMITEVERDIKDALDQRSHEAIVKALDEARDLHQFDIVVIEDQTVVYKSIPYELGDTLLSRVHEEAITRVAQGPHEVNGTTYNIWYSIYKLSDSDFLNAYVTTLVYVSLFASLLLALTVFVIYRNLLNPLRHVKKSLDSVEDYNFEDISAEDDNVNKSFKRFANRLEIDMSNVSKQQTQLERELQNSKEHLRNAMLVSRSMIHDLKTPVHQSIIQNDIYERDYGDNEQLQEVTHYNIELSEQIMSDLNSILKLMNTESHSTEVKEDVDLVHVLTKAITRFSVNLRERNLFVDFDAPESVIFKTEESAMILLFNNLLSNMTQYTKEDEEIRIAIFEEEDKISIVFENPATKEDIKRMRKSENLFNTVNDSNQGKYTYSSGNGLYLIKD